MIYVGSCDTEDWRNDWRKFSFASQELAYILKYSKIETHYVKL